MGKPGFPIPPAEGRVWEGKALPRRMCIPSGCGEAAWMANVKMVPRRRGVGKPGFPTPRPAGGWGNPVSPFPHPREGVGGLCPPKKYLHPAVCGASRIDG